MAPTPLRTWLSLLALLAVTPPSGAATCRIADDSELVVRLFKAGAAKAFTHDHVVRAVAVDGEVAFDPADPAAAWIRVEVDARSLAVDEPADRERFGLTKELDDDSREEIAETMRSAEQLDVEAFPTIAFRSTSVAPQGESALLVSGDFTLHGVTRPVSTAVELDVHDGGLTASTTLRLLQSDYGIEPYSAMLGAVRNQDEVELSVTIRCQLREAAATPADGSGSSDDG